MSNEELKLMTAEEVNTKSEEPKSDFPSADNAKGNAAKAFRKRLVMMLNESIEGGINKLEVECSGVDGDLVDQAAKDLESLGYEVRFNNVIKVKRGYTARKMIITY